MWSQKLTTLRVVIHRKYRRPCSLTHLIDHIFGSRITLILLFARLFYKVEPKEHHRKTRLTKNENMTITLAKVMVRSTTDLSDKLLERWLELRRCFSAELADAIVYKLQQLLVDFNFTSLLLISSRATKRSEAFVDFNFTFLFIHVGT